MDKIIFFDKDVFDSEVFEKNLTLICSTKKCRTWKFFNKKKSRQANIWQEIGQKEYIRRGIFDKSCSTRELSTQRNSIKSSQQHIIDNKNYSTKNLQKIWKKLEKEINKKILDE